LLDPSKGDEGVEDFLDVRGAGSGEGLGESIGGDGVAGGFEGFLHGADALGEGLRPRGLC